MDLRTLFAKYAVGGVNPKDYIAWAEQMLVEGEDSPALRILAGMDLEKYVDPVEVREYFDKTISELGIDWPEEKEALRQYAERLADDILSGQGDTRAVLSELASLYPLSDYEEALFSVWYALEDAIDYFESEGVDHLYGGLTKENINETILREAELYKAFSKIDLPKDFHKMMYCGKCGHFGVPKYIRQEMNCLPAYFFCIIYRRTPIQKPICTRCRNGDLLHSGTYEARKKYLSILQENVGM